MVWTSFLISWPQILICTGEGMNLLITRAHSSSKLWLFSFLTFLKYTFPFHLASWGSRRMIFFFATAKSWPPLVVVALSGRNTGIFRECHSARSTELLFESHAILDEQGNPSGPFDTSLSGYHEAQKDNICKHSVNHKTLCQQKVLLWTNIQPLK